MPAYPPGYKPTPAHARRRSNFKVRVVPNDPNARAYDRVPTVAEGIREVQNEVRLMRGTDLVIETDHARRQDGGFIAGRREPEDQGAVVKFRAGGRPVVLPCDKWATAGENLHAIALTLEAKRGILRWGTATVEAEYEGYLALGSGLEMPAPAPVPGTTWTPATPAHAILGVQEDAPPEVVNAAYKALALKHHPDRGGSQEAMAFLNRARDRLLEARPA